MIKNSLKNWKYNKDLENLLFATQRLDEALFFYTQDTYKANIFNTRTLIDEFLEVRDNIDLGLLNEKNDEAVIEEIIWSLSRDKEAVYVIGEDVVNDLKKKNRCFKYKRKSKIF